jgi:hypothetical protein
MNLIIQIMKDIKTSITLGGIVILLVLLCNTAKAQQEKNSSFSYRYNSNDSSKIYFTHETDLIGSSNIYTVYKTEFAPDPICIIYISYDNLNENIDIIKKVNKTDQGLHIRIHYPANTPTCIIKNGKLYDTEISYRDKYKNLITMPELSKSREIKINQISSIDSATCYKFYPVRQKFFEKHKASCIEYYNELNEKSIAAKSEENKKIENIVNNEKANIENISSELYQRFKEKNISIRDSSVGADENLQKEFKKQMDRISQNIPYQYNYDANISYKVVVDPGKFKVPEISKNSSVEITANRKDLNEITETITRRSMQNPVINPAVQSNLVELHPTDTLESWIKRYFKNNIKVLELNTKSIKSGVFLDIDFFKSHDKRIDSLRIPAQNKEEIRNFLKQKMKESDSANVDVELPTNYYYNATINAVIEKHKLKYKNDEIREKNTFVTGYDDYLQRTVANEHHNYPDGRYLLLKQRISINNNDSLKIEKTISAKRKYIYFTHIGASFGVFIRPGENIVTDFGNSNYINLFFIRHHMGVFIGGSFWKDFDKYYEGGIYVGPTNYLFFKLGVAYANWTAKYAPNQTHVLMGMSLIFPVIHFEGGYNFATESPYIMFGLNIPINN